ncbi:MAG: phosphotransferase [Mariprofundales bacterium]|nr:phosphotransferase [Mariprofundales bacterium]
MADLRLQLASSWLQERLGEGVELTALAGDASSRRYFRVTRQQQSWILMDAPQQRGVIESFVRICNWLMAGGVRVPEVVAQCVDSDLLLLEDLGDRTWAAAVAQGADVETLMADALDQLLRLQSLDGSSISLPPFDAARIQRECALYIDWYLPYLRGEGVGSGERKLLFTALTPLFDHLTSQPQVAVHLDYHSRNLMVPDGGVPLGVIDFQDACTAPVSYDLASLLYDCYQSYGIEKTEGWSRDFYAMLPTAQRSFYGDWEGWHRSLLLTSLQRHIKVCGIFVRLAQRDGKEQFLESLPQTRAHLLYEADALADEVKQLRPWLA